MNKVFLFDFDSTLINEEVIDCLAAKAGVTEEVSGITSSAMAGEIDFSESLIRRVSLLSGLSVTALDEVRASITLTKGAEELISDLQARGDLVAVVSGGFTEVISPKLDTLKISRYRANSLEIIDGKLSGKVQGKIIDRRAKAEFLKEIAFSSGITISNTVAIGDGANDIDMIQTAGIGVAFCAKPALIEVANRVINTRDLREVLKVI